MKCRKKLLIILVLIAINIYFLSLVIFEKPTKGKMKVIFFNVGQGDASLIMAEGGINILIDGGPDKTVIEKLDKYLPIWNKKIDLVILTHPHSDHISGLAGVFKKYAVSEVWMTGVSHNTPEYMEFLQILRNKKIEVKIARADVVDAILPSYGEAGTGDTKIKILYPNKNLFQRDVDNLNNSSIVLKASYKGKSFLFTGDIEKEVENELCGKPHPNPLPFGYRSGQALKGEGAFDLDADVLKISHHGSSNASSECFLQATQPEIAVISVGANNDFGMPSLRILKRLENMGIKIYRTDIDLDVVIETDGEVLNIF